MPGGVTTAPSDLLQAGLDLRLMHDTEGAFETISGAARLYANDTNIAAAHAHIAYDTWRPSVGLFRKARRLDEDSPSLVRGLALALVAEGAAPEAERLLDGRLRDRPNWIEGHHTLATIRATSANADDFDRSFADAVTRMPQDLSIRLAWFHRLSTAKCWERAQAVLDHAERDTGPSRALMLARIYLAAEADDAAFDPNLFSAVESVRDPGVDICRIRYALRHGRFDTARDLAERHIATSSSRLFWPYLSLAWRLLGDRRADWLDGAPPFVTVEDLRLDRQLLAALEQTVRKLLVLQAPFHEQSVRGGIQTDRHLFFNPDPAIQSVRRRIAVAVRDYIDQLPEDPAGHPLLSPSRSTVCFEGSWSVLLRPHGYHAPHTHNMGWISSAFYVSLPEADLAAPDDRAGWLALGTPPPELALGLSPYVEVEPKAGSLVLFPSTMWHRTNPISRGERLTIAFDVALPRHPDQPRLER